jgi:hypothetical protein
MAMFHAAREAFLQICALADDLGFAAVPRNQNVCQTLIFLRYLDEATKEMAHRQKMGGAPDKS